MTDRALDDGTPAVVAELTQSRDASAAEALAIFRMYMNTFKSHLATVRGRRFDRIALVISAGVAGALIISVADSSWVREASPVAVMTAAALVIAGGLCVWVHFYYRRCAEVYRDCFRAIRQFRIEDHAVIATNTSGVMTTIPWRAISGIAIDKDSLAIYLSPIEAFFLPKAACEGQDVDGFCAELQHRWRAECVARRPEIVS